MEVKKLYAFYIKGWDEPCLGIIQSVGSEWILIRRIVNDYLWDGLTFIKRKAIQKTVKDDAIIFKENVLYAKGYMNSVSLNEVDMENPNGPMQWLYEKKIVCMITPKDETVCYVVRIRKVLKRKLFLQGMTFRGCWENRDSNLYISQVLTIEYDNDYISSLMKYNQNSDNLEYSTVQ